MAAIVGISDSQRLNNFEKNYSLEKQKIDYSKKIASFAGSAYGVKKIFRIGIVSSNWLIKCSDFFQISSRSVKKIINVKENFNLVHKTLVIPKLPTSINDVKEYFNNYLKKDSDEINTRKRDRLIQKTFKLIQETSVFILLGEVYCIYTFGVFSNKILCISNKLFLFLSSCFKLKMDSEDHIEHSKIHRISLNQKIDGRLKTILYEINNLDLIKMIKCIASVVLGVFCLIELVFATAILAPGVTLVLSSISLSFSIWTHLYKETMSYSEIKNKC